MQKVRVPQNSFNFGEVSDTAIMRTDSPVYAASAQRVENLMVQGDGGLRSRVGTEHIYTYSDITYSANYVKQSRLVHFTFSDDEQYIISIENGKVRCFFLDDTDALGLGVGVHLVETITQDTSSNALPFNHNYLHEYTFAQSGDVMFICHPLFMPRMLVRTALDAFEVTPYSFDVRADNKVIYQPYSTFQNTEMTLDPSATTGSITLTTSSAYWDTTGTQTVGDYLDSLHVGVVVRYDDAEIEITSVQSSTQATGTVVDELKRRLTILNPLRTIDGSATVEVTHLGHGFSGGEAITIEDSSSVGGLNASQINGARTVGSIIDENTYTITAGTTANTSEDGGGYVKVVCHAPTRNWDEQSFSAKRGYPTAVVFHENRLVFGGTIQEPDALWFSKIGKYFNFDVGTAADDDSINLVAATGDINAIRYLVSNRDLQVFTDSSELYVPTYLNQAITPVNVQIRKQTPYGCNFVAPHPFDGATLFVQAGGKVVREYLYTDGEDAYTSTAVSTIAPHLINSPIGLAVVNSGLDSAESYAAVVNSDGIISLFNSARAERRASWVRMTIANGYFLDAVGIQDRLFANIYLNGTIYFVEFGDRVGLDNYVYSAISGGYADVSAAYAVADTVSVLGQNGSTIDYLGSMTVVSNGGTASVDVSGYTGYTHVFAGVPFTVNLTTNPVDGNGPNGPFTGSVRGISAAIVDFRDTRSASVNGRPLVTTAEFNGKKEFRLNGYGRDPQVTITQNEPLPIHINGIISELVV
jgi:hypothetical protein